MNSYSLFFWLILRILSPFSMFYESFLLQPAEHWFSLSLPVVKLLHFACQCSLYFSDSPLPILRCLH